MLIRIFDNSLINFPSETITTEATSTTDAGI